MVWKITKVWWRFHIRLYLTIVSFLLFPVFIFQASLFIAAFISYWNNRTGVDMNFFHSLQVLLSYFDMTKPWYFFFLYVSFSTCSLFVCSTRTFISFNVLGGDKLQKHKVVTFPTSLGLLQFSIFLFPSHLTSTKFFFLRFSSSYSSGLLLRLWLPDRQQILG